MIVPALKIIRTYCLSLLPDKRRRRFGAVLRNHIYSTRPLTVAVDIDNIEEHPRPENWRRGYYGKGRDAWDSTPRPFAPSEKSLYNVYEQPYFGEA